MSGEVPIERMLETVEWRELDLTGCSFVGEPGALYATHEGTLEIGAARLRCYQLNDGQRVFDAASVDAFFTAPEHSESWPPNRPQSSKEGQVGECLRPQGGTCPQTESAADRSIEPQTRVPSVGHGVDKGGER